MLLVLLLNHAVTAATVGLELTIVGRGVMVPWRHWPCMKGLICNSRTTHLALHSSHVEDKVLPAANQVVSIEDAACRMGERSVRPVLREKRCQTFSRLATTLAQASQWLTTSLKLDCLDNTSPSNLFAATAPTRYCCLKWLLHSNSSFRGIRIGNSICSHPLIRTLPPMFGRTVD